MDKTLLIDYATQLLDQAETLKEALQASDEIHSGLGHCLMKDMADIGIAIECVFNTLAGICSECGESIDDE